jgi:hypothetical protein
MCSVRLLTSSDLCVASQSARVPLTFVPDMALYV